ncbi:MAG TPA: cytochrome o ubiquinol oxidase subunit III [Chlamydiales bacterium]|nr:cytochrome o ubiquinol oxidase subunit III [Chlamydiales bacterium]
MSHTQSHSEAHVAIQAQNDAKTIFGFWVYLMTDCILFATLFATYAVLHNGTYGGPSGKEIFHLPYVLAQTLLLLISSFTCGLGFLAAPFHDKTKVMFWLAITFLLGAGFLGLELNEFIKLFQEGNSWKRSAFLSSFFTLVGTHGMHITFGLLWTIVLVGQICVKGFTAPVLRRITCFTLYWHFLDVVWIFIFTIVYLMGAK